MSFMDQYPDMKGFYIVMDNTPIHIADDMEQMTTKRGYRSIYLPPYSPELIPIENFRSTMNDAYGINNTQGDKTILDKKPYGYTEKHWFMARECAQLTGYIFNTYSVRQIKAYDCTIVSAHRSVKHWLNAQSLGYSQVQKINQKHFAND